MATNNDGPGTELVNAVEMGTVEALRRLATSRDAEAWKTILILHGTGILRMAERIGGMAFADDASQETLLQIRTHAGQFSPSPDANDSESVARRWIMCIAYRTALKMLRSKKRRDHNEQGPGARRDKEAIMPDETVLIKEQFDLVRQELAALPDTLRDAVCMRYYGEFSYADLSAACDCTEDVARKRVERGLSELRSRLAAVGLVVGIGALSSVLGESSVNAAAATGVGTTNGAALKQFSTWQALLNSSQTVSISGIVVTGGLIIFKNVSLIVAALAALALVGGLVWYMSNSSNKSNTIIATRNSNGIDQSPALHTEDIPESDRLAELVKKFALRDKPDLNAETIFKIEAYPIDGLQELKLKIINVHYLARDGEEFNSRLLIYHAGNLNRFCEITGGSGLMSAVVSQQKLYYTYSWGSGVHRSHVGQLSCVDKRLLIYENDSWRDDDVFVTKIGDTIRLEKGVFETFNTWSKSQPVGTVLDKQNGFNVVNSTGKALKPFAGKLVTYRESGTIETQKDAIIYHLTDGVLVHETFGNGQHYYLIQHPARLVDLTPKGLSVAYEEMGLDNPVKDVARVAVDHILVVLSGESHTVFNTSVKKVDAVLIEGIIHDFNSETTIQKIYNQTK